jgi:lysophospholipase L1-like esterase
VGSGTSNVAVNQPISGLAAATTYYFRVVGTNSAGPTSGSILSFVTSTGGQPAPTATTVAASGISTSGATLNGSVNPNGASTDAHFVWGTDPNLVGGTTTAAQNVGSGSSNVAVNQPISGLAAATTYYFRVVGTNSAGPTDGSILSFVTSSGGGSSTPPQPPVNYSATGISDSQIRLTWVDVSDNEDGFTIQRKISGLWKIVGSVGAGVEQFVNTGLQSETTYEYRVRACNVAGCVSTGNFFGTTLAPGQVIGAEVGTNAATSVGSVNAVLNATVNPNGQSTELWFEYGTDPGFVGAVTSATVPVGSGSSAVNQAIPISGLTAVTRYYFRPKAQASGVTTTGPVGSFVTEPVAGSLIRIVTFGDSNTDWGYSGTSATVLVSSYVSNRASTRLAFHQPNSSLQLAGKIESQWAGSDPIVAINHGIAGTTSGTGTSGGAPNALTSVSGVTRFRAEVLGTGYLWSGGETGGNFPSGPISRTLAFTPDGNDFGYISMGTNDPGAGISTSQTLANLQTMINAWIGAGHAANRLIITTLAPRNATQTGTIPAINAGIRSLATASGVHLVDLAAFTSDDDGLTWESAAFHVGDSVHYSEAVRDWLASQVVAHIAAVN